MTGNINRNVLIAGAILLIALALALVFRQASAPQETINDYSKIPPKGAGRLERR